MPIFRDRLSLVEERKQAGLKRMFEDEVPGIMAVHCQEETVYFDEALRAVEIFNELRVDGLRAMLSSTPQRMMRA